MEIRYDAKRLIYTFFYYWSVEPSNGIPGVGKGHNITNMVTRCSMLQWKGSLQLPEFGKTSWTPLKHALISGQLSPRRERKDYSIRSQSIHARKTTNETDTGGKGAPSETWYTPGTYRRKNEKQKTTLRGWYFLTKGLNLTGAGPWRALTGHTETILKQGSSSWTG